MQDFQLLNLCLWTSKFGHFWTWHNECQSVSCRYTTLLSNFSCSSRVDSIRQCTTEYHILNYLIYKSGVGVIYHKNENFRASGSIRYKCWHSNYFRKKYIFNILFCVQTGFSHSLSIQVAITEYWRMGGLKNKHLLLTVLKARKFKTRAPTELM